MILTLHTQPRTILCIIIIITIINNGTHIIIFYRTTQKHFSSSNTKTLNKSQITQIEKEAVLVLPSALAWEDPEQPIVASSKESSDKPE